MRVLTFLFTLFACVHAQEYVRRGCTNYTGTPSLVLWTYSSFMTDPSRINFTYHFEDSKGLPRGSVVLCRMKSVDLIKYLDSAPPAGYLAPNIIIGLDTVLSTAANDSHFISFDTPHLDDMVPIVTTLGHYEHMKPFDWGLTSILYNTSVVLELNRADDNRTFNLQTFLDSGLVAHFVAIDPTRDTAGLAFLLWTIAELGDAQLQRPGKIKYDGGWHAWWQAAFKLGLTVVDSWNDAFDAFKDPNNPYINIMSSYGASPAYDWCNFQIRETRSIVSWFNNTRFGWAQVEGYVLVADSPVARQFVDFFTSPELQDHVALHQYMNPVNKKANIEQCFIDVSVQPQNATLYNTFPAVDRNFTTSAMKSGYWTNGWKEMYNLYYKPYVYPTSAPTSAPSSGTSTNTSSTGLSSSSSVPSASTGTTSSTGTNTNGSERMHPMMIVASIMAIIMVAVL